EKRGAEVFCVWGWKRWKLIMEVEVVVVIKYVGMMNQRVEGYVFFVSGLPMERTKETVNMIRAGPEISDAGRVDTVN
ncbi:hypothetical protein Tco_0302294, partial [Tanacetum coccineum]